MTFDVNRQREVDMAAAVQTFVESHLQAKGIESLDGLKGPSCQTGEDYDELIVRVRGIASLTVALAGAVATFGSPGCRCYWRIRTDLQQRMSDGDWIEAYVRFRMTNKPELPRSESV